MAAVTYPVFEMDDPSGTVVLGNVIYDSVSLLITGVQYENTTSSDASISWSGHSFTLTHGTALTTQNVSGLNIHMVQITNSRGQQVVEVPGGEIDVSWPAA